jgi:hypothetical protein
MLGPQPVVRLRTIGPKPWVDSRPGQRHPPPMPCAPGETLRSSPAVGWLPSARPQISVCRSAASTGWYISSLMACVSPRTAGHRRSRSSCPATTSPNPCCCPHSARRRRSSPRANTAVSRTATEHRGSRVSGPSSTQNARFAVFGRKAKDQRRPVRRARASWISSSISSG